VKRFFHGTTRYCPILRPQEPDGVLSFQRQKGNIRYSAMTSLLFFSASGIRGGIPLAAVRFVERMVELIPDPDNPPGRAGTINYHGERIPVYSLAELFGSDRHLPGISDVLIITDTRAGPVALWADEIHDVEEYTFPDTGDTPLLQNGHGTLNAADGTLILIDVDTFLTSTGEKLRHHGSADGAERIPRGSGVHHKTLDETGDGEISRVRTILAQQAKKLARPAEHILETGLFEVIRFRLMYREYALETRYVREVIMSREITPVPGTPDYIAGICAVRGEIISLVDLRALFNLHDTGLTDLNRVIIVSDNTITFGILVDYIPGIGAIPVYKVKEQETGGTGIEPQFIRGIVDDSLIFLDCAAILSDPRMIIG
jgi:chemotaxis signal transduction protein